MSDDVAEVTITFIYIYSHSFKYHAGVICPQIRGKDTIKKRIYQIKVAKTAIFDYFINFYYYRIFFWNLWKKGVCVKFMLNSMGNANRIYRPIMFSIILSITFSKYIFFTKVLFRLITSSTLKTFTKWVMNLLFLAVLPIS